MTIRNEAQSHKCYKCCHADICIIYRFLRKEQLHPRAQPHEYHGEEEVTLSHCTFYKPLEEYVRDNKFKEQA